MQTRNQHHFNADTVREAIVDRVMELEADNTFNGTNVQAKNHNGGTDNQNNGIGDGNSNGSSHHNERNVDGNNNNNAGNNGSNSGPVLATMVQAIMVVVVIATMVQAIMVIAIT